MVDDVRSAGIQQSAVGGRSSGSLGSMSRAGRRSGGPGL
jgi:hypothetical protein